MSKLPVERTRRSLPQWQAVFEAQARSGMNQREFCEFHGISVAAFYNAKSRNLRRGRDLDIASCEDFVSVLIEPETPSEAWDVELTLSEHMVLRVRRR